MALFHPFAALMAIALAGCATAPAQPAAPGWYVMRHLEKADGPDPGLSETGRAHAERLAAWFAKDPPKAIYVSATRRARETAAPLAARLGLTPHEYDPGDTAGLVARVKAETGTVLIVGHSNTVPDIVSRLGGAPPPTLGDEDFGDIFRVRRDGGVEHLRIETAP